MLTCPLSSSLNPNSILNIWKIFALMELKEDLFMLLLQPVVGVWAGFLDLNFGCPKIHDSSCGALGMLVNLFMSVSTLLVYYIFLSHVYLLYIFFIYLAVPGLMQDLQSSLQHVGYLVVACKLLAVACGIYFSDQGSNSGPLHWECRVLATGPPGKSHLVDLCEVWVTGWMSILQRKAIHHLWSNSEQLCLPFVGHDRWSRSGSTGNISQHCPSGCLGPPAMARQNIPESPVRTGQLGSSTANGKNTGSEVTWTESWVLAPQFY